jgi:hypothetical protein
MTELCFGFVPQGVLSDLVDVGNWKVRCGGCCSNSWTSAAGPWQQFACRRLMAWAGRRGSAQRGEEKPLAFFRL